MFPVLLVNPRGHVLKKGTVLPAAAETHDEDPEQKKKKGPGNVCLATASECCRYELPLLAAKYNM